MKVDCHMHMILDGVEWRGAIARHAQAPDREWIKSILSTYQKQGFTYLRDGGDRWGAGKAARELASEFGITYRTPLAPLCKKGHYGSFIGEVWGNLREYTALVRQHRQQGADFIKIMISGLIDFDHCGTLTEDGLPAKEIRDLIHIAHEEGFSVMAHANGARTVEFAADAGVDSVEHGAYLDHEALCAMKESGTVWVPTLSTVGNLRGKGRFNEAAVCSIWESTSENVRRFGSMGGMIAPGSDAGAWAVPHDADTEYGFIAELVSKAVLDAGTKMILEKF